MLQEATDPAVIARLAEAIRAPHHLAQRGRSLGFVSHVPIADARWHRPRWSRHAFLEIVPADVDLRVFGVHLSAVHAAWTERRRMLELRSLLAAIARHQDGFHVLTGDFNTLAPGETLDTRFLPARLRALVWLSGGRIRWRTIQHVLDRGYLDAFRQLHPGAAGPTFPVWRPHLRLDFAFVPEGYKDRLQSCEVIAVPQTRTASDHLPLLSEFRTL